MRGFHSLEPWRDRLLRWSLPNASIDVVLPAGTTWEITLDTGNLRGWTRDLAMHASFSLDGQQIPREHVRGEHGVLTIHVFGSFSQAETSRETRLSWTCEPIGFPKDPRQLGIPVLAVAVKAVEPNERHGSPTIDVLGP